MCEIVGVMHQGNGYLREAGEDEYDIDDSDPVSIRLIEYDDNNEVDRYKMRRRNSDRGLGGFDINNKGLQAAVKLFIMNPSIMWGVIQVTDINATISMLETMPEEARRKVYAYTQQLFFSYRPANPYSPVDTKKVLEDIDASSSEFSQGLGKDARTAIEEMRRQHGFI